MAGEYLRLYPPLLRYVLIMATKHQKAMYHLTGYVMLMLLTVSTGVLQSI